VKPGGLSAADIPGLEELLNDTTESIPAPALRPSYEKTVLIGPEITIPGINDLPVPTEPASLPSAESPFSGTMRIELPQHPGVGGGDAALPPSRVHGDESTSSDAPAPNPDATIRLNPKSEEPS
jgi:hypothetical protein